MRLESLRPAYFFPRVGQFFFQRRHKDCPWLNSAAVLLLENWLKNNDRGFEWGSGRSTSWFARKVGYLVSIESNVEWYDRVQQRLTETKLLEKVDYRQRACELTTHAEPDAHPYAEAIQEFSDSYFDFILVDGKIRLSCMRKALAKLKPGGLLILDNAEWYLPNHFDGEFSSVAHQRSAPLSPGWAEILDSLKGWRWINTTNRISDTRFWVKPLI